MTILTGSPKLCLVFAYTIVILPAPCFLKTSFSWTVVVPQWSTSPSPPPPTAIVTFSCTMSEQIWSHYPQEGVTT